MELATVFKLSIYGLTAFVGLALGAAEAGWIPYVSLPVTLLAYYWCELQPRLRGDARTGMGETPAGILAFLALCEAAYEFFGSNPEGKLLSGIHLVVFLTWVVLLQRKTIYRYWLLLALGVLQIAVGAVLTAATWYGLCLVTYLFGGIWTLSVFSLYRADLEIRESRPGKGDAVDQAGRRSSLGTAFNTVRFENGKQWVSPRLVGGVAFTALMGLVVSAFFYTFVPRVWVGSELGISDDALPTSLRRTTGLATEVRLGDMRMILESNDPVLRIRLFDNQTDEPLDPQKYAEWLGEDAPQFRGAVLTEYKDGQWRTDNPSATMIKKYLESKPDDPRIARIGPTVRQEIRLDRYGSDVLLCMGRAVAMRDLAGYGCGRPQLATELVIRKDWFKVLPGAVDYISYSELPSPESVSRGGYVPNDVTWFSYRATNHLKRCGDFPEGLPLLVDLARQIVDRESGRLGKTMSNREKARAIESYLRDSGQFVYSLTAATIDQKLDPIEDFLVNRRAGHCEYFASALTLMLRSIGIPARLVSGFKGGEIQDDGALHVEKRYAHVWVEAWLEDKMWVTMDATPEEPRNGSVTAVGTKRNLWSAIVTHLTGIWESNILDISYERQRDLIYEPMQEWIISRGDYALSTMRSPRASLYRFAVFIANPRNWLTASGIQTLAVLFGIVWLIRYSRWFRRFWNARRSQSKELDANRIEFYDRFVRLMQTRGHLRRSSQTQAEFVCEMADDVSQSLRDPAFGGQLLPIGELFYQVRFGDDQLSTDQKSQLDTLLSDLERMLGRSVQHGSSLK